MSRIVLLITFLLTSLVTGYAQAPDEWIDFSQQYFKIPVAKDGIYRVTYLQLQQNGFPVESVDPRYLRLYHRGVEQAILVDGEQDSQFNPIDYVEFYGRKNDGSRDTRLYETPSHQPHKYYNLYSDTTAYFLTIGSVPGKRMQIISEPDNGVLVPQTYVMQDNLLVLADDYSVGRIEVQDVYSSNFDHGEGWNGYLIWQGFSRDYALTGIVQPVTTAPAPRLELILTGRSDGAHTVRIYLGDSFRPLAVYTMQGFEPIRVTESIEWSDISSDGRLPVRVAVDNAGKADYVSLCSARLTYARSTNAAGATELVFKTEPDAAGKVLLTINNIASTAAIFDVTDPSSAKSLVTTAGTSTISAVIPGAEMARSLMVTTNRVTPAAVIPVRFRQFVPGLADYIIISHPAFRKPGLEYSDPVKAYASYRASEAGGGYDTLIVHSRELYDQFNYGEVSSLAIHEFLAYVSRMKLPAYVFIIGKGLELTYRYHRSAFVAGEFQDYVPPAGFPGSDVLYSVGVGGSGYSGGIPTGRLPATKPEHVSAYLNKVRETEALPFNDLWRKRILHLSGGIESWEPLIFRNYLQGLEELAAAPHMGAQVEAIAKQSRDVQIINVSKQVNEGLGLVTFLGHSSTSTLDFDIGYVTNPTLGYNNPGKYPMMIMNGCEVGSFFYKFRLFGEDWILADKLGASGFIAHNSYGLLNNLMGFSRKIYEVGFNDENYIARGIGDIKLEAGKRFLLERNGTGPDYAQVQQMVLLGDPALPLFGARKPDLEVRSNNIGVVALNNEPVTSQYDSFGIRMIVRNYGVVKNQLYKVEVERILSDNTSVIYDTLVNMPAYSDTILVIIRRGNEVTSGANQFRIKLDPDNIVDELNEENNTAEFSFVFEVNGTKNLYPANYAIVSSPEIELTFQATDVYSQQRNFLLEIDTLDTFDSQYRKQFIVNGKVLGMQVMQLVSADTLAYYWRTRLADPAAGESAEWTNSSFTFIADGGEGWAQVHFPQFAGAQSVGLVRDSEARRIYFEKSVLPVTVRTFDAAAGKPMEATSVLLDGAEYNMSTQGWGCRPNTINLIAFDRKSTYPYVGIDMKWYEVLYVYGRRMICGRQPFVINNFQWDEVSSDVRPDLIDYVNRIAQGDSVLLYTIGSAYINLWPDDARLKLSEFGISSEQLSGIGAGEGVVIFGRKGAEPGTAKIYRTGEINPPGGELLVEGTITGGYTSGQLTAVIGPASAWHKVSWNVSEKEVQDKVSFNIYGIARNGEESLLVANASDGLDISFIDAAGFPNVKFEFYSEDNTLLTSPQLHNWIVQYTPVAEGVLLPLGSPDDQVLDEGQSQPREFGFYNISDKKFTEDVQVRYTVFNSEKNEGRVETMTIAAPMPGDTTVFSVVPPTVGMTGWNDFEVFANPAIQPEQYYDNNVIQLRENIFVAIDETSPVTDITFDGRHIENGEFVSLKPLIRITMFDDNKYLFKQDTVGMKVFLRGPCEDASCDPAYIPFSGSLLKWHPATLQQDFYIDFTPTLASGEYKLIVETADVRGNHAANPYTISFIVDDQFKFVFTEPYPNPCIGELFYGFTFSGKDNVEKIVFDVSDLAGRLIFSEQVATDLVVGSHEFMWAGTDNRGNLLNTGLYLISCRVTVGGQEFRHQTRVVLVR